MQTPELTTESNAVVHPAAAQGLPDLQNSTGGGGEAWELSKENIQPLRQGRRMNSLRTALTPRMDEHLVKQKQMFETYLRTYDGDDPLEIWWQYIEWLEQNYPKGGREANLPQLLQRCVDFFKGNSKYQNDLRFLSIWLKYANINSNPLEVFDFMHSQNIGCAHADFYLNWSWSLELMGDLKRANAVLKEGIQRNAQPQAYLIQAQKQLQIKVVKAVLEEEEDDTSSNMFGSDQRSALAALKPSGIKNKAPVIRTGSAKLDLKVRFPPSSASVPYGGTKSKPSKGGNIKGGAFQIFNDENAPFGSSTLQSKESATAVPYGIAGAKENERKPGKWSKVKVAQKNLPNTQALNNGPVFNIHEDQGACSTAKPAVKLPKGHHVLSAKKWDWTPLVAIFEEDDPKKVPAYCKNKVYGGGTEFSFEELRAQKYFRKNAPADDSETLKKRIQELEAQLKMVACNNGLSSSASAPAVIQNLPSHAKQNLLQLSTNQNESIRNASYNAMSTEKQTRATAQRPLNQQENISCGNNKAMMKNMTNFENSLHAPAAAPQAHSLLHSPTMNMKEALQMVGDMWNGSIFHQTATEKMDKLCRRMVVADVSSSNAPLTDVSHQEIPKSETQFSVFCDATQTAPLVALNANAGPVNVSSAKVSEKEMEEYDENAENIPPPGYMATRDAHPVSGILTPSVGIPCGTEEEHDEAMDAADDDDGNDDDDGLMGIGPLPGETDVRDFTLGSICNTMNFANHPALLCSTPFVRKLPSTSSYDACPPPPEDEEMPEEVADASNSQKSILLKPAVEATDPVPTYTQPVHNTYCGRENLSTIIETSREYMKSSSSSSSSSASCLNTQLTSHSTRSNKLSCLQEVNETALEENSQVAGHDFDPFDSPTKQKFLNTLNHPLSKREGYHHADLDFPILKSSISCKIGGQLFVIESLHAKGASGRLFVAHKEDDDMDNRSFQSGESLVALKATKPANVWEFYICSELRERLAKLPKPNVEGSIINVNKCVVYKNGSILVEEYYRYGTLLDIVNLYRASSQYMPECLVLFFTLELMITISKIHQCQIIHADLKPDNIMVKTLPTFDPKVCAFPLEETSRICLIDFGQAIDMTAFPPGTTFNTSVKTDKFQCVEMKEGRPWTYQTDIYGLLGTIHLMLFNDYMDVQKNTTTGKWEIKKKLKRYWQTSIWSPLFESLLNIPDCSQIPDLMPYIDQIQQYLSNHQRYQDLIRKCLHLLALWQDSQLDK